MPKSFDQMTRAELLAALEAHQPAAGAAQASDSGFYHLVELAPTAIFYQAEGRFIYLNQAALRLFGAASASQLLGQPVADRVNAADRAQVQRRIERLNRDKQPALPAEETIVRLDGTLLVVEVSAVPFTFQGRAGALVLVYDVTARAQAEQSRRSMAERLAELRAIDRAIQQAGAPASIAEAVLVHLGRMIPFEYGGVALYDNALATGVLLASVNGPPQGSRLQLGPLALQAQVPALLGDLPSADESPAWPQLAGARSIVFAPLVAQGELIGSICLGAAAPGQYTDEHAEIAADVSTSLALALANARLLDRANRARHVAEQLHLAGQMLARPLALDDILTILLDVLQQLIPYDSANIMLREGKSLLRVRYLRGYEHYTDTQVAQAIAFDLHSVPHLAQIANSRRSLLIADTSSHPTWQRVPGTEHIGCWLGVPLIANNELVGIYSIDKCAPNSLTEADERLAETLAATTATAIARVWLFAELQDERAQLARRVAERTADLSVANAELERAVRLKDEFLANMSHELRTPLNAVLGFAEALSDEIYGELNGRQQRALQSIAESGRHLLDLINEVLDLAKISAGKLELEVENVGVAPLCREALRMVAQAALGKQIALSTHVDPAVGTIRADLRRLKQILVNLLSNAVKFTPAEGQVGLAVRGDAERQTVTFTVWDTGIGIAAGDLPQLFQPFVQIDRRLNREYEGTGLGLALVQRLAEAHGGSVAVESTLGQGSRFHVVLPWAPALPTDALLPHAAATAEPADAPQGALVLLAEDYAQNRLMLETYLAAYGYHVVIATDGEEAVARARELRPALILMDIQMPKLDGLTAIQQLRADAGLRTTPIIALTALAMPGDRERCLAAGADDYVTKPVDLRALRAAIEAQLGRGARSSENIQST